MPCLSAIWGAGAGEVERAILGDASRCRHGFFRRSSGGGGASVVSQARSSIELGSSST